MSQNCAQHPEVAATYQCQGCQSLLCEQCVDSGHALLFCRLCGEQALPLNRNQPVTAQERQRRDTVVKPYTFQEALAYPFRGLGLYLYIGAVFVSLMFQVLRAITLGGLASIGLSLGLGWLIIALQFKIVATSAEGKDELPDWPDYSDFVSRLFDLLAYLFIAVLQFGPVAAFAWFGRDQIFTSSPNILFWFVIAVLAWCGNALSLMALGAAGRFDRFDVLLVHCHVRAFLAAGADAVTAANLIYGIGIVVFLLRVTLAQIPFVGAIVSTGLLMYWTFTGPHLVGVVLRRHIFEIEKIYA